MVSAEALDSQSNWLWLYYLGFYVNHIRRIIRQAWGSVRRAFKDVIGEAFCIRRIMEQKTQGLCAFCYRQERTIDSGSTFCEVRRSGSRSIAGKPSSQNGPRR